MARDPRKRRKRANAAARAAADPPWTPFEEAVMPPEYDKVMPPDEVKVVLNSRYQVNVRAIGTGTFGRMCHLSIKRRDRQPIRDWRELQRIKNEVVGPEAIGFEVFPDEGKLVDTCNQYHLWVSLDADQFHRVFPFLFHERIVSEACSNGSVQEPFPADNRPTDLTSKEEISNRVAHALQHGYPTKP